VDVTKFLNRIGIYKSENPSLDFLTKIQNRHLLSIPFEDLDIPSKRIELNLEKIYEKIILSKRGGFCYELNGLLHWLLTSINFKVDMLSARVFNSNKNEFGPEYDHLVLQVHLDKDYLVDVGFGDSFRVPIQMPEGEVFDVSGKYKIFNTSENIFELRQKKEESWQPQYSFSTEPKQFNDFSEMCAFQQDSPTSHFRTRMVCTIATETGRITLSNNSLTITEGDKKDRIEFSDENIFYDLLKKHFAIEIHQQFTESQHKGN
jgi:N-hydroxyarylamine O-acetyltransferase